MKNLLGIENYTNNQQKKLINVANGYIILCTLYINKC